MCSLCRSVYLLDLPWIMLTVGLGQMLMAGLDQHTCGVVCKFYFLADMWTFAWLIYLSLIQK